MDHEEIRTAIQQILGRFEVKNVASVENKMSLGDKISLYYLLNDDPRRGLSSLKSGRDGVITEWCRELSTNGEWKLRLIESLALMQLYRSLQNLGYRKRDLAEVRNLLDMASRSRDFDVRKALYSALDTLTEHELEKFVYRMDGRCVRREPANLYRARHIELYLLEWQCEGKIGLETDSLDNVVDKLNSLHLTCAAKSLQNSIEKLDSVEESPVVSDEESVEFNSSLPEAKTASQLCYPIIDCQQVGLCIIVNQEHYRPDSKHKVRRGSKRDCLRLQETMKKMNVQCDVLHDLVGERIFPSIELSVQRYFLRHVHSVLFVVIMAHGDNDHVFGVDGKPVDTRIIGKTLSNMRLPCLKDKPKVVIFQACRGDVHYDAREIEADGPEERPIVEAHMDNFIICHSTIGGFTSYRDTVTGSMYIQKLCEYLELMYKQQDVHQILMDLARDFHQESEKLKLGDFIVGMVPVYECCLIKRLFLYPQ